MTTIRSLVPMFFAVVALVGLLPACNNTGVPDDDPALAAADIDIFTAAKEGNVEAARRLIESNQWDYSSPDGQGRLPLDYAVEKGNAEIVRLMLQGGADPNIMNPQGKTMVQVARDKGHTEVEQLLIQAGAR